MTNVSCTSSILYMASLKPPSKIPADNHVDLNSSLANVV